MWVDLEQVKYCDQMWSELWHFMFVSFGKTFCRTLVFWYVPKRYYGSHVIRSHPKEGQVLSQKQA